MKYDFIPEEAQTIANLIIHDLTGSGFNVTIESPYHRDAPYRTSILARKGKFTKLIEAQGHPSYGCSLQQLAHWLAARREYCEFAIATHDEAHFRSGILTDLHSDGVGLLIVTASSGQIIASPRPRNYALIVTPDPTLSFGVCKKEVVGAVEKFNDGDRKNGLQDICEIVESETENVGLKAIRKGWLNTTEGEFSQMKWANQIQVLAAPGRYISGKSPILSSNMAADLQSFRGARNLINHKVQGKREDMKRQKQFVERMMQGPRLIAELLSLKRKIR